MERWLMSPPTIDLARHFQSLCSLLFSCETSLPTCHPVAVGKIVSLLDFGQCNVPTFRELYANVKGVAEMLGDDSKELAAMVPHLAALTSSEAGVEVDPKLLLKECKKILRLLDAVIQLDPVDEFSADPNGSISERFFTDNEQDLRNTIARSHPRLSGCFKSIDDAVIELIAAVNEDFAEYETEYKVNENTLCLSRRGKTGKDPKNVPGMIPVKEKKTDKVMAGKFITARVQDAQAAYFEAVEWARAETEAVLRQLNRDIQRHIIAVTQASHWAVIFKTALLHTVSARQKGWCQANILERNSGLALDLKGLSPYWMSRETAVLNDVRLQGIFLLTAPNMSGKSTLMRSILVAALLANCGLFVPCSEATVAQFDNFLLRTASYDVPSEGKSAFALEMDDVRVATRDCTDRSLLMLDEIGRILLNKLAVLIFTGKGTSARDGSCLAGAILEYFDRKGVHGIFATHLHEIFQLPLRLKTVQYKRMGFKLAGSTALWTYTLEDGFCDDSRALDTARAYRLPSDIVDRAAELIDLFPNVCRGASEIEKPTNDVALIANQRPADTFSTAQLRRIHTVTEDNVSSSDAVAPGEYMSSKTFVTDDNVRSRATIAENKIISSNIVAEDKVSFEKSLKDNLSKLSTRSITTLPKITLIQ